MGILPIITLYFLWSSSFPIGKWMLSFASPVFLTGFRMLFAGVIITSFLFFKNRGFPKFSIRQWLSLLLLGFLSIYLANILEFYGLQSLSAGKTCFIYSLSPFCAAFFSYIHFGEKMNSTKWIGLIIGFLGFSLSLDFSNNFNFKISLPELAVIGAAIASVYGWILLRVVVKDHAISPLVANGYSMFFGGIFALVHSFLIESWQPLPMQIDYLPKVFSGIALMTVISNLICYNLYGVMLKRFTATFLSFFGLLSPIFASINAWLFINEPPSLKLFISTAVVSIGLWIFYKNELKQGYVNT